MRRIIAIDETTVRVQPGVVHAQLNRQLAKTGRLFGPDPATGSVSTMGSVVSLDAAGSRWLRYGATRGRVAGLQVVLPDGEVLRVGRREQAGAGDSRRDRLVHDLSHLLQRNQQLIAEHRPKSLVNRSGYHVFDALDDEGGLDLAGLITGSEGTLALITEATVEIDPLPQATGICLLFFDRLENAAVGALAAAKLGASACDLMDRRLLSLAREADVRYELLIPREAEAMLLVEQQGDSVDEVRQRLQDVVSQIQRRKRLAFDTKITLENDEIELYWRLARRVIPSLYRLKGTSRPLPFIEDIAVPPATLPDFLISLQNVLKEHQVTASLFGHAGHGQLHIRPFLDLANPSDVEKMQSLAADLYESVVDLKGTISGEHGDGLSRTWFVRKLYGPALRRHVGSQGNLRLHQYSEPGQGDHRPAAAPDGQPASGSGRICPRSAGSGSAGSGL